MEPAITKMSPNGQIVIPSEIRKEAKLEPATKFIVYAKEGNIFLKRIRNEELEEEMKLFEKIQRSEEQISQKKYTKVDKNMSIEDIDKQLME